MSGMFYSSTPLLPTHFAILHFLYQSNNNEPVLYCRTHFTHVFCTQKIHIADTAFNDDNRILLIYYLVDYRKQNESETIFTNVKT